ncbi:MAG TPA: hypothetical protein VM305_03995 [Candidatus Limnocylindrales bacterium]|nr:hypothetical protein [Candidatus Limnocylindrales bacterium]
MRLSFPDALTINPQGFETVPEGVHPGDRHVVATALAGRAQVIVTSNVRHFSPATLESDLNLLVQTPDDFLTAQWDEDRLAAAKALAGQIRALRRPPRTLEDHVAALRASRLTTFAEAVQRDRALVDREVSPRGQ